LNLIETRRFRSYKIDCIFEMLDLVGLLNSGKLQGSIPLGLVSIPSYQNAFNIGPVGPPEVFQFLGVITSGSLLGILGSEAAIALQHVIE